MEKIQGTQEQDNTKTNPEQYLFPLTVFPLLVFFMYLQFDTNGDGEISTSELREAMKKLLGQQVGHRDIEEIIRDVDLNGDGRVDFEGEKGSMLTVHLSWCESVSNQKLKTCMLRSQGSEMWRKNNFIFSVR